MSTKKFDASRTFTHDKPWLKKRLVSLILILVVGMLIAVPLLINYAYMEGMKLLEPNTAFAPSDLLIIYSALVGVVSVFFSIQYAQKNYKEDFNNRVLPYIALTPLLSSSNVDLFALGFFEVLIGGKKDDDELIKYKEYKMDQFYIVIDKDNLTLSSELSTEQQDNVRTRLSIVKKENGISLHDYSPINYIPLEVHNVGNGAAVNLTIIFSSPEEEVLTVPQTFKVVDKIYMGLYFDFSKAFIQDKKYTLSFMYQDIYQNSFEQVFYFTAKTDQTVDQNYSNYQIKY